MDAQREIDRELQQIVKGYPLSVGLTSVADVVTNLDVPEAARPSLFNDSSNDAQLDEPILNKYAREIETLIAHAGPPVDGKTRVWRQAQLTVAASALGPELETMRPKQTIGIKMPPPPFPISGAQAASMPPTSAPHAFAHDFLTSVDYPYPSPLSLASAPATPPMSSTVSLNDSRSFFANFLNDERAARATTLNPIDVTTPTKRVLTNGSRRQPQDDTSSDPLKISDDVADIDAQSFGRMQTMDVHVPGLSQAGADHTPRAVNGHGRFSVEIKTESQRAAARSTPVGASSSAGVESAIRRIALVTPSRSADSSTKGTVKAGEGKDVVERAADIISDLFSAEDSIVSDTSSSHVGQSSRIQESDASTYFDIARTAEGQGVIRAEYLRKLTRLATAVQAKGKGEALLQDVGESGLLRLLKMLERSWQAAEHVSLWPAEATVQNFGDDQQAASTRGKGKSKTPTRPSVSPRKRSRSQVEVDEGDEDDQDGEDVDAEIDELHFVAASQDSNQKGVRRSTRSVSRSRSPLSAPMDVDEDIPQQFWTIELLEQFDNSIELLADAVDAVRAALAVLTVTRLHKSLYSADYILSLLATLRSALDTLVIPLLETRSSSHLDFLATARAQVIGAVSEALTSAIQLVSRLLQQEHMSEDIVISVSYFALTPFFHEEPPTTSGKGKKAEGNIVKRNVKMIRLASLGLVRAVFSRYPAQRDWIVDEVLTSLLKLDIAQKTKGSLRLRNGTAIHAVSALLMHLVQTVPATVRRDVVTYLESGQTADKLVGTEVEENPDDSKAGRLMSATRQIVQPAVDAAGKTARTIVSFLLQRSCKVGKAAVGSTESEYRLVLDNLVQDLLNAFHLAEWPGAEVLLTSFVRSMLGVLVETKTNAEATALKSIALDHLGHLGARVRAESAKVAAMPSVQSCSEVLSTGDVKSLDELVQFRQRLIAGLARADGDDTVSLWYLASGGLDLADAVQSSTMITQTFDENDRSDEAIQARILTENFVQCATTWWTADVQDDVFGPNADELHLSLDTIVVQLSRTSLLSTLYATLLDRVVDACESPAVAIRTKAMRAISLFVAQDPDLFHHSSIRRGIESRMHDSSPAVRDATIELVGKYVVASPDLAAKYLPLISNRITDTGLSVRRRVVKLLKALYPVLSDSQQRIEICRKLVWRSLDEDDGIKELAVDAVHDLWFPKQTRRGAQGKADVSELTEVMMAVAGKYQDRAPPVDEVLCLMLERPSVDREQVHDRLGQVIETLVDALVSDALAEDVAACVRTIHTLNGVDDDLLNPTKAQLLLPFLMGASSPEEQLVCDYLLKIFRATVTSMPRSTTKFGKELQTALMPMLNKPPQNMNEVVACFCSVVHMQTKDYASLISVFRACFGRLAAEVKKLSDEETKASVNLRQVPLLSYMVSLLAEHGNFDALRKTVKETRASIDALSKASIPDTVFGMLVKLYQTAPFTRAACLTSLGFLFRGRPTLMQDSRATAILDEVFASRQPQAQLQLLRILQDFFTSRAKKTAQAAEQKKKQASNGERQVRMEELVGVSDEFAESGVPSAVSQRYIDHMLAAATSNHALLQRTAVDILLSIAHSGFIHPMTLSPTLVALSSCSDSQVAAKAFSALALLHQKHASMLASRFLESTQVAHAYAVSVAVGQPARGFYGDPPKSRFGKCLLQKEKRQYQLDFLRTLSRIFDRETGANCSEEDVSFARFLAEALSTLDFKRLEEPMTIIKHLNASLAVSGLQVMHQLQATSGATGLLQQAESGEQAEGQVTSAPPISLARQSVVHGLALLLRDHLKHTFSITDAKLAKHTVGKKSAQGDRAPIRRADAASALGDDGYTRMPFALQAMQTDADLFQQRANYITLIEQDGTINAMDELDEE
ncbi:Sister chromatid cohesion protein 2 [Microbotryomycetes sp. JL201]|nr:Sister chromatid cohesion protein 2 [Microbotryomycetes sp. JL201]